jgi:hypothetical protein
MPPALALKRLIVSDVEDLRRRYTGLDRAQEARLIAKFCLWAGVILVFLLAVRGKTFSLAYVHDLMIFYDGGSRILDGQLPNRDFHTPLGLLAYLLPAFGIWAGGSLGTMMPLATAAFAAIYLPLLIHVCTSRLPLKHALIFAFWAIALIVTPASIGETEPSFGMFYNRWGFGLLGLLFLLFLPRLRGRGGDWKDAAVGASVLLLTFYLKISYFAVAAGFMLPLLYLRQTRRMALIAGAVTVGGIAAIHLFWSGTGAYLQDVAVAAQTSGAVRGSVAALVQLTLDNAATLFPFLLIVGLAAAAGVSVETLFLSLAIAGGGVLLANQNYQALGISTLVPAALLAAAALETGPRAKDSLRLAATLLLVALSLPPAFSASRSVLVHMAQPYAGSGKNVRVAAIDGYEAQELLSPSADAERVERARLFYRSATADLETVQMMREELTPPEYFGTIKDGLQLLKRHPALSGKVFTLDFSNPFNAMLGRSGPRGIDSWYHRGRTFDEEAHRSAEQTFADVEVIMVPKAPADRNAYFLLKQIHGAYVAEEFKLVATSDYWSAYARTDHPIRRSRRDRRQR